MRQIVSAPYFAKSDMRGGTSFATQRRELIRELTASLREHLRRGHIVNVSIGPYDTDLPGSIGLNVEIAG